MKARKGMTLIEIVVSMGVYAVIALLVVRIMSTVNAVMRSTNQLNDRLSYEAKYADNVQTNDDSNHPFEVVRVDYEIVYDIKTTVDPSGVVTTNGKRINSGGTERAAFEYTVDTVNSDAQILGEDLHSNVNYRFMTFNKIPVSSPERPTTPFRVLLRPVAYFSGKYNKSPGDTGYKADMAAQFEDNMTEAQKTTATTNAGTAITKFGKVTASGTNFNSGSSSQVVIDNSNDATKMVLNHDYEILVNPVTEAEVLAGDTVSKLISFSATKNNKNYSTGNATYYMYVRYGSEATSVVFYNQVVIEYNVNTGALNPLKSE